MVTPGKPAVSLAAVPGRRQTTIDMAQRLEQEGFTGLYCPSLGDGLALCEAIALNTREIPFGSSIANMYARHPYDFAQTAAFLHEVSGGRFRFGVGVSHVPTQTSATRSLSSTSPLHQHQRSSAPSATTVCRRHGQAVGR